MENTIGVQIRRDDIGLVGLYRTEARSRFATLREDRVAQVSAGLFGQIRISGARGCARRWGYARTRTGLRWALLHRAPEKAAHITRVASQAPSSQS